VKKINGARCSIGTVDSHSYICDLVYVEGPVLSLFRDAQRNWLYLWCDTDRKQSQRWLAFPVTRSELVGYLEQNLPLLSLVQASNQRLMIDTTFKDVVTDDGKTIGRTHHRSVKDVTAYADEIGEYLPAADSFFDEELAPDISLATELSPSLYEVPIDGKWFLADLDRFSKVYAQLYAFFYCTKPRFVNNLGQRVSKYLSSPWTGGYSRVNLFEALKGMVPSLHDLEIKQIRYASPGEIKIEALRSVNSGISGAVQRYIDAETSLRESEKMINQLLSIQRLRKLDLSSRRDDQLSLTADNIAFLREKSKAIAVALDIEEELSLLSEYSPNVVVSAKVLMAVVDRIRRLANFETEGLLDLDREADLAPAV